MGSILNLRQELLDVKMPTYAHMAITRIIQQGKAKFVVTSNHDNMHRKSGLSDDSIAELFGNAYIEKCLTCKTTYQRKVVCPPTGRYCDNAQCGGRLIKTGVRYGQETPKEPLKRAERQSKQCDLAIVLGSSMGTSPFCNLPPMAKKMVICNLSATSYDNQADHVFRCTTDDFMKRVVNIMGINIGTYAYRQEFEVGYKLIGDSNYRIFLRGHRPNEPCTCVTSIEFTSRGLTKELDINNLTKHFELELQCSPPHITALSLNVMFKEAYASGPMTVDIVLDKAEDVKVVEFIKEVDYTKL